MTIVMLRSRIGQEDGGVLVFVAVLIPTVLVFASFVVDVANWFEHKRHLQLQADAAALAAASNYVLPCNDGAIKNEGIRYSGSPGAEYNFQIGGTSPSNIHLLYNSRTYYNQPDKVDDTVVEGEPCAARMVDVKLTETGLPWYWRLANVPFINAHARVSILQQSRVAGALPIGVPDVNPERAKVEFIDEATGEVIAGQELMRNGTGANGEALWDNSAAPASVVIDRARIGTRVILSGSSSLTCGDPLVECYDSQDPNTGLLHIRGWTPPGSVAAGEAPKVGDVSLFNGTCGDAYFSSTAGTCFIGVTADVKFGGDPATVGAKVTAVVQGNSYPLTYNATTGLWESTGSIALSEAAGPVPIELRWEQTAGTVGTATCKTGGGNDCKGTFGNVHRTFRATEARSGPVKLAQVEEGGAFNVNSFERCSATNADCTHDLVVTIGLTGSLQNASDVNDPIVALRVTGGSQNQSLDCDPAQPSLKDELANGCGPAYQVNTGTACPSSVPALWGSPEPWSCVAVQTGTAVNQVPAGMNLRILGDEKATTCTDPNNWADFPNLDPSDPRIVQLFLTPFGAFDGSGNTTVPVQQFATFYVTGWAGKGGGFSNPCEAAGDDPAPDGYIVGHFIKYVHKLNDGSSGEEFCDLEAFGSCIAVLTE